jgi:hypothetical protein
MRWKLQWIVVGVAVIAATTAIGVAEATDERGWEDAWIVPFPCSQLPNDPNEPGTCYRVVGGPPGKSVPVPFPPELEEKACELPPPPEAPPGAPRPFCDMPPETAGPNELTP